MAEIHESSTPERQPSRVGRSPQSPEPEGQPPQHPNPSPAAETPQAATQEQTDEARARYEQELQKQRDEAERAVSQAPMMGAGRRAYVPPPNTPAADVKAGPTTTAFAVGGKIFQRYGKYFEQVGTSDHGILAIGLDAAEPAIVYHMSQPSSYEEPPAE